nr:MAG TPA: hypothetical protein [Caudoviricetes sp.]
MLHIQPPLHFGCGILQSLFGHAALRHIEAQQPHLDCHISFHGFHLHRVSNELVPSSAFIGNEKTLFRAHAHLGKNHQHSVDVHDDVQVERLIVRRQTQQLFYGSENAVHGCSLVRDALVVPLLVNVYIGLALVAVVGDLVVHPIGYGGAHKRLPVLQGFAEPYDEHVLHRQLLAVSHVHVGVKVVHHQLLCAVHHSFVIHFAFLLICTDI